MKKSNKKLLELQNEIDKKLFNEGFFDNIRRKADQATEDRAIDKAHTEQKAAERERRNRVMTGRAIPPRLYKSSLRRYYTQRAMPIPPELDSNEDDHSAYKRSPSDVEDDIKSKSSDFIGGALGLDSDQQKGLETYIKAGQQVGGGIASAAGSAYNYIKGLFGSKAAKKSLPAIEKASEEAAKKDGITPETINKDSNFTNFSSMSQTLAGILSSQKFNYFHIKDFEKSYDKANPSLTGAPIDEVVAKTFIDNYVANIVIGNDRKTINPKIKKIEWKSIYKNIKNDNINKKTGMGYMSGHYIIISSRDSGRKKLKLVPFSEVSVIFPNIDIKDLEN